MILRTTLYSSHRIFVSDFRDDRVVIYFTHKIVFVKLFSITRACTCGYWFVWTLWQHCLAVTSLAVCETPHSHSHPGASQYDCLSHSSYLDREAISDSKSPRAPLRVSTAGMASMTRATSAQQALRSEGHCARSHLRKKMGENKRKGRDRGEIGRQRHVSAHIITTLSSLFPPCFFTLFHDDRADCRQKQLLKAAY